MRNPESLWSTPWPSNELEDVPCCPACGSAERTVFNQDLVDDVFIVAPGHWTQKQCSDCSSVYLDPRPDEESIGKAYGVYYTHSANATPETPEIVSGVTKIKRLISNGYRNKKYGVTRRPASKLGYWVTKSMVRRKLNIDIEFRYLPKHKPGQKLLDIGCGNGDFLITAKSAGWDAYGIDPDMMAVKAATSRHLDVKATTVDSLRSRGEEFDAITLSHVIEHVHDPRAFVSTVHKLLKPGGFLYIDTPNISSYGSNYFSTKWRGHECPRHITIFNPKSLKAALSLAGFENISFKRRPGIARAMFGKSYRLTQGVSPYDETVKLPLHMRIKVFFLLPTIAKQEFITLTATRPK